MAYRGSPARPSGISPGPSRLVSLVIGIPGSDELVIPEESGFPSHSSNRLAWRTRFFFGWWMTESSSNPPPKTRAGWGEAARTLHERREDGLLDDMIPTGFDESEWVWE